MSRDIPAALASIKRYSFEYVQGVPAMLRRDDGEFWKVHEVLPHLPPPADGAVAWTQQGCLDEIRKRTNGSTEIICWPTPDDDYNVTLYAAPPAERIEKLEREKQLHAGDTLSLSNELNEWKERAQDAERALAEARRDAERYRWLTNPPYRWYIQVMSDVMDRMPKFCVIGKDLDAAIDAATGE